MINNKQNMKYKTDREEAKLCRNLSHFYSRQQAGFWNQLYIIYCPSHGPVQTHFWRYFCYISLNQAHSPRSFESFRQTTEQNFNWIRQQMKNFTIDPHCKNCLLSATLWRCRKWAIFTMRVYREILYPLSELNEILPQSSSKTFKWSNWDWVWLSETSQNYRWNFVCTGT